MWSLGSVVGGSGVRARVILVIHERIWNALTASLFLSTFDDTGSLGFPLRRVIYFPPSILSDCLLFLCGELGG